MAVVIAFFICWAPFHTQRITAFVTRLLDKANKNITSEAATKFQEILFFTSGISMLFDDVLKGIIKYSRFRLYLPVGYIIMKFFTIRRFLY